MIDFHMSIKYFPLENVPCAQVIWDYLIFSIKRSEVNLFSRKDIILLTIIVGTASEGASEEPSNRNNRLVPCLDNSWDRQLGPGY